MRNLLASPRMRRRLAWLGAAGGVGLGVWFLILIFPSPKHKEEKLVPVEHPFVTAEPAKHEFTRERSEEIMAVADKFLRTAVARKHLDESWSLVSQDLKHGFTKRSWMRGDIPVVPYPVDGVRWDVSYSYANEVDLTVALFPTAKKRKEFKPTVFDLTLVRRGSGDHRRWLVSNFLPTPDLNYRPQKPAPPGTEQKLAAHTSGIWLLVPLGIIAGLFLTIPLVLGVKGVRSRRAYRAHVLERQRSSFRPS